MAQFSETVAIKRPPARSGMLVGQPERWFEGYLETRSTRRVGDRPSHERRHPGGGYYGV